MNKPGLLILLFLLLNSFICAQDNPFFSQEGQTYEKQPISPRYPEFIRDILNGINHFQRDLNNKLSALSRRLYVEGDCMILFLLTAIALLYGIVHALGPGHGKIVIVSYALSNPLKAKQGILLGIFIAIIHTAAAIILVSILYFIMKSTYAGYSQEPKKIIYLVSYGLIAGMGAFLLLKTIVMDILKLHKQNSRLESELLIKENKIQNIFLPALAIGLVPCEGAVLILIFSITINAYGLGIILTSAMSIGMALTISIFGLIAIYTKKGALKLIPSKKSLLKIVNIIFQIIGSMIILLFGLLMYLSKL